MLQLHCWFLSAMVPYWLGFDLVFRRLVLRLASLRSCCALLLLLALPPYLALALPRLGVALTVLPSPAPHTIFKFLTFNFLEAGESSVITNYN